MQSALSNLPIVISSGITLFATVLAVYLFFLEQKNKRESVSKKTFESVSIKEQISQHVLESLLDGIFMVDDLMRLTFINNAAKKILHIANQNPSFLDIVNALPPTYMLEKLIREAISKKTTIEEKEIVIDERILRLYVNPIQTDNSDSPHVAYCLVRDVTFEKSLGKVKDDFTNMMIHELRAPITAVKGASEILLNKESKLEPAEQQKMLLVIEDQSKRLLDQVSSLLDLARVESGRFVITKTPSNIKKLIEQVVDAFTPQAKNKKIELSSMVNPEIPPNVPVDPTRIGQVLNNLVSNAIKYTNENGKIKITADIESNAHDKLAISVSDTGIGIPKEKQGELFSKFFQAGGQQSGGIQNHIPGSGLGLFITREIVTAHGGTISLNSEPGKGTIISFTIPL